MGLAGMTFDGIAIAAVAALNGAEARQNKAIVEDNANAWAVYAGTLEREIDRLRTAQRTGAEELRRQLADMTARDAQWKRYAQALRTNLLEVESALRRESADAAGLEAMYTHLVKEIQALDGLPQLSSLEMAERKRVFDAAWLSFATGSAFSHPIAASTVNSVRERYIATLSKTPIV